jgi:2,3-bisphosphoglycerate-dependent phosphoglycerate mutase
MTARRTTVHRLREAAEPLERCHTLWATEKSSVTRFSAAERGVLILLLVRHAEPYQPTFQGTDERDRSLTERGREQALRLARSFADADIEAIYSSPYRRAIQTVEPLARRHGLRLRIMEDLRERLLTPLPLSEEKRLEHSRLSYEDPHYRPPGGETRKEAEMRGVAAISEIRDRHAHGLVVAGTHAGLMRIILSTFDARADLAFGWAMTMPAVYQMTHDGMGWSVDLRPFGEPG